MQTPQHASRDLGIQGGPDLPGLRWHQHLEGHVDCLNNKNHFLCHFSWKGLFPQPLCFQQ